MDVMTGGDPENYMQAPPLGASDGNGPSFIASLLDLLGIGRQVAKEPKPPKGAQQPMQPPVTQKGTSGQGGHSDMLRSTQDLPKASAAPGAPDTSMKSFLDSFDATLIPKKTVQVPITPFGEL